PTYPLACWTVTLGVLTRSPGPSPASTRTPSLGRKTTPRDSSDERRDAHPFGHRAGRPRGGRAAPAPGVRRAEAAGRPAAGARAAGADLAGHGAGPRGVCAAGGGEPAPALERPRPLLRRGGRGHAPHPRRAGPTEAGGQARRRPAACWAPRRSRCTRGPARRL